MSRSRNLQKDSRVPCRRCKRVSRDQPTERQVFPTSLDLVPRSVVPSPFFPGLTLLCDLSHKSACSLAHLTGFHGANLFA
jgi:hypothetical protein